ncbi:uncharacterized protein LOC125237058 [Leguminivora glycinivorella]|uniref:uncharacterized protein LOC125237058 n=1 Tax=Leguminivora glycinivorella TaxID=1035111 RepID=UPI00200DE50B|nr:uncharacterized protein LOC125237058 [Leguminivora glycinivorella]
MALCSALDCKNKGVHAFPKDPKRRKAWEKALRIKNFKAKDSSRLCSMHFTSDDYYGQSIYTNYEPKARFLKKTAVPSIFPFNVSRLDTASATARQQRLEMRSQKKLRFEETVTPSTSHQPSMNKERTVPHSMDVEKTVTPTSINQESTVPVFMDVASEIEISADINDFTVPILNNPKFSSKETQIDMEHVFGTIHRFKNDDKAIKFYTGFESYRKFYFVYSTLSPMAHKIQYYGSSVILLSTEDQFFLTIMKLRQNKCIFELSKFFNVSTTTVSNIFITWINFIHQLWSRINIWPSKELVQYYMPQHFKEYNKNIRVILDATEIAVQKPKNTTSQQASWSSYKHANTLKVLVGATPGGLLTYCSQAFAGSISDRQTVERSDLLSKCQSDDTILADRGFTIQDMFADKNITVKIPSFLKGKSQLPGLTVIKDRELASKRVHIERIIGLTKTYKILKSELDHSYVPIASKIFFVCFMCCNFRECIMKKK